MKRILTPSASEAISVLAGLDAALLARIASVLLIRALERSGEVEATHVPLDPQQQPMGFVGVSREVDRLEEIRAAWEARHAPPQRMLDRAAIEQLQAEPQRVVYAPDSILHWEPVSPTTDAPPAVLRALQRAARATVALRAAEAADAGQEHWKALVERRDALEALETAEADWLSQEIERLRGPRPGEDGQRVAPEPCDLYREAPTVPGYCWCGHSRGDHDPGERRRQQPEPVQEGRYRDRLNGNDRPGTLRRGDPAKEETEWVFVIDGPEQHAWGATDESIRRQIERGDLLPLEPGEVAR